jgi:hypothetical protein
MARESTVEVAHLEAAPVPSLPHFKLPEASVSMVSQFAMVEIWKPPVGSTNPAMVEEAAVALMAVVWRPPAKVEVAVEVETMTPNCPRPMSAYEAVRPVLEEIPPV